MDIKSVVADFANRLTALIEGEALERARAAVLQAIGAPSRRGPGRPPKLAAAVAAPKPKSTRKKPPRQLCPVPGCKNTAAPIFGMVCAKHKDLPKAKIAKFREARRAKKLGLPAPKAKRATARRAKPAHRPKPARKAAARKVAPETSPQLPAVEAKPAPAPAPVAS